MRYHTILTNAYSYQVGNDPRASGGVTHVEVGKTANGTYRRREVNSNGNFESKGPSVAIPPHLVQELIDRAVSRVENDERQGRVLSGEAARTKEQLYSILKLK